MDPDTRDLVAQLATRLGMLFEDAAPVALALGGMEGRERELAVSYLGEAVDRADALLEAIHAIAA